MIYFDNSATTRPDESVLASFLEASRTYYANPASLHLMGREAEALLTRAREQLLHLLGIPGGEAIFTSGGTEANNLALIGFAKANKMRGKHILVSAIEHPSILRTAEHLEEEGYVVERIEVDSEGRISLEDLKHKIRKDTTVVSVMHVNNEIGTIQPIQEISAIIKKSSRAIFHSDIVQSFGRLPVDLSQPGPDAVTISGHKIHGLKGSGVLVMRKGYNLKPVVFGGGQESGFRSGTVSVADALAISKAARLILNENKSSEYRRWRDELLDYISKHPIILPLAPNVGAPHILAIAFSGIRGEVAVNFFQENGITVSTSSACSSKSGNASHVIEAIHVPEEFKNGVIRISFGKHNTKKDVQVFIEKCDKFLQLLERGSKDEIQ